VTGFLGVGAVAYRVKGDVIQSWGIPSNRGGSSGGVTS
jgi:hypothetical protein